MIPSVVVKTARLQLRLVAESDAQAFMDIHQHPDVIRHVLLNAPPGGLDLAWRNIAMMLGHWHLRGFGPFTVVESTTGEVVGRVGFWMPGGAGAVELGWVIRPSRWGQGFATEATSAALNWLWTQATVKYVESHIQPDNVKSIKVATKVGMRFDRTEMVRETLNHVYSATRNRD